MIDEVAMSQSAVLALAVRTCICKEYLEILGKYFECDIAKLAALALALTVTCAVACAVVCAVTCAIALVFAI